MRARNIKPGFFKNEDLAETGPWGRLLFAGLWCMADREGRLEYRPKRIKAEIFPYDDDSPPIENLLNDLACKGFLQIYSVNGSSFIQISKFREHQNPHPHEAKSKIPPPPVMSAEFINDLHVMTCNGIDTKSHGDAAKCRADIMNPDSLNPDSRECVAGPAAPSGDAAAPRQENAEYLSGGKGGVVASPIAVAEAEPPPENPGQDPQPGEKIARPPSAPKFGPAAVASLWNELGCRPEVQKLTDARRRKLAARLRERASPDFWRELFHKVAQLQAKGRKWLTFDWVIANDTNLMKVIEGNYDQDFKGPRREIARTHQQGACEALYQVARFRRETDQAV